MNLGITYVPGLLLVCTGIDTGMCDVVPRYYYVYCTIMYIFEFIHLYIPHVLKYGT